MRTTRVAVGTERYVLAPDEDAGDLAGAVLSAVRSGGDFVDFTLANSRMVRVLVTASSTISLETIEWDPDDDGPGELGEGSRLHIDGDYWLE
ncbi:MAG: hypothetical protein RI885_2157 [Actinomycetota bacterium]|jgi:hypothetical protein